MFIGAKNEAVIPQIGRISITFFGTRAVLSLFLFFQDKEALQIPSNTYQRPLPLHGAQATQQELTETLHVLDDAEDGLHSGFALGVKCLLISNEFQPSESTAPGTG